MHTQPAPLTRFRDDPSKTEQPVSAVETGTRDWQSFALLLIDVQRDFWPAERTGQFPQFPENIAQLLAFCRIEGIEVIHTRVSFQPNKSDWFTQARLGEKMPCLAGTVGAEVMPFALAQAGEKVITKHRFDSFLFPDLLKYLEVTHKRFVLVAGLITSVCVLFSAFGALQHDFLTAIVEDCCADDPLRHKNTFDTYNFLIQRTTLAQLANLHQKWLADLSALDTTAG